MRAGRRVDVVIPALNEEPAIGQVIAAIPAWIDRIVVVDNASTDRTAEVARQAGALVVHEPQRGYGAACLAGIAQAREDLLQLGAVDRLHAACSFFRTFPFAGALRSGMHCSGRPPQQLSVR